MSLNEVQFLQKLNNTHNNGTLQCKTKVFLQHYIRILIFLFFTSMFFLSPPSPHSAGIGQFEFLQMELLRTGKCDQSFLDKVAKRFTEFDIVNDGEITLPEIIAANIFESYDTDDSERLDFNEFRKMIKFLISGKWNKRFGRIVEQDISNDESIREVFNICDSSGDNLVSREEFLEWITHISINQPVLWRGRVKFYNKRRKCDDYIVVLTKKSFEFRPAKTSDAIFTTTEAIRLKHIEQIRFDDDRCVWISVDQKSEFMKKGEDVVPLELSRQKIVDKLIRACLKIERIREKVTGVRKLLFSVLPLSFSHSTPHTRRLSLTLHTRAHTSILILSLFALLHHPGTSQEFTGGGQKTRGRI